MNPADKVDMDEFSDEFKPGRSDHLPKSYVPLIAKKNPSV